MPGENVYPAEAAPSFTSGAANNEFGRVTPEGIDRLASELHLVAERLRNGAEFRRALARASVEQDEDRVEYLHP